MMALGLGIIRLLLSWIWLMESIISVFALSASSTSQRDGGWFGRIKATTQKLQVGRMIRVFSDGAGLDLPVHRVLPPESVILLLHIPPGRVDTTKLDENLKLSIIHCWVKYTLGISCVGQL